jgi:hypothetical protein
MWMKSDRQVVKEMLGSRIQIECFRRQNLVVPETENMSRYIPWLTFLTTVVVKDRRKNARCEKVRCYEDQVAEGSRLGCRPSGTPRPLVGLGTADGGTIGVQVD